MKASAARAKVAPASRRRRRASRRAWRGRSSDAIRRTRHRAREQPGDERLVRRPKRNASSAQRQASASRANSVKCANHEPPRRPIVRWAKRGRTKLFLPRDRQGKSVQGSASPKFGRLLNQKIRAERPSAGPHCNVHTESWFSDLLLADISRCRLTSFCMAQNVHVELLELCSEAQPGVATLHAALCGGA